MSALAWVVGCSTTFLCLIGLIHWILLQRQSWRLRHQQESPSIYMSFDLLKGMDAEDIQILSRPGAWPRTRLGIAVPESETWYCHALRVGYFSITAEYRYRWWGWRVQWRVNVMDELAMREALKADAKAYRRAFGHHIENRLYA